MKICMYKDHVGIQDDSTRLPGITHVRNIFTALLYLAKSGEPAEIVYSTYCPKCGEETTFWECQCEGVDWATDEPPYEPVPGGLSEDEIEFEMRQQLRW